MALKQITQTMTVVIARCTALTVAGLWPWSANFIGALLRLVKFRLILFVHPAHSRVLRFWMGPFSLPGPSSFLG